MQIYKDERGTLEVLNMDSIPLVLSQYPMIPFEPKRCFRVQNVPVGTKRGNHAHKKTKQFCIVLKGTILFDLNFGWSGKLQTLTEGGVFIY